MKKQRCHFADKGSYSQSDVFSSSMYGCEIGTIRKAEHQRIDAFELWCWRRLLRVSWTVRRSNQSILKETKSEYSLEGLMLKLKLQYFGHLMPLTHWERPWCWERLRRQEEKGTTEDEMVGWHHWLNGHVFEQAPGVDDGQGRMACCSPWGAKCQTRLSDWTELSWMITDVEHLFMYLLGHLHIFFGEMFVQILLVRLKIHSAFFGEW